ncbi:hypothetical protein DFP94_107165 [Fontibacillus phaseoli]|uniref:Uncharacterized protein n=1 Tax=Fontibacillus phaseoli TaxID=1416533 RepID=A0A369B9M0_9BACL|nr:hypothetical protein DFP94_107165 [Fontibacillus phaseoli]
MIPKNRPTAIVRTFYVLAPFKFNTATGNPCKQIFIRSIEDKRYVAGAFYCAIGSDILHSADKGFGDNINVFSVPNMNSNANLQCFAL